MFRFTIRDLLWATAVAALALGWALQTTSLLQTMSGLENEVRELRTRLPSQSQGDDYAAMYRRKAKLLDECIIEYERLQKELDQLKRSQAVPAEKE